jgi:EF hand
MIKSKAIPVAVATIFALTTAGAAFAQGRNDQGKRHDEDRMETASYRHHDHGKGRKGGRGHGDETRGIYRLIETFDVDGDGGVTQEEILTTRSSKLSEFDANNDGSLDLSEYEALWLDAMRERMVDRFQAHDDDGDGAVTVEEFNEEFAGIVERRDRNGDGVLNADDTRRPPPRGPGHEGAGESEGPKPQ